MSPKLTKAERRIHDDLIRAERLRGPSRLEVHLCRRDGPQGPLAIRVKLHSKVQPNYSSTNYVDPDDEKLEYKVSLVAGALAEHLCQLMGDNHNPDDCANAAGRMLRELKANASKLNQVQGIV